MTRWMLPFFDVNTACCLVPRWCIFRRLDYLVDTIQQILARPPPCPFWNHSKKYVEFLKASLFSKGRLLPTDEFPASGGIG